MPNAGIARLSAAGAGSEDAVALQEPPRHARRQPLRSLGSGLPARALLNAGFAAWEDEVTPTGSLSLG